MVRDDVVFVHQERWLARLVKRSPPGSEQAASISDRTEVDVVRHKAARVLQEVL